MAICFIALDLKSPMLYMKEFNSISTPMGFSARLLTDPADVGHLKVAQGARVQMYHLPSLSICSLEKKDVKDSFSHGSNTGGFFTLREEGFVLDKHEMLDNVHGITHDLDHTSCPFFALLLELKLNASTLLQDQLNPSH